MKHPLALLVHSLCRSMQTPRHCQTKGSAFSQEMGSNATAHWADGNAFLGKTQGFDVTFLQQAEVGENITHKLRKWSVVSPFVKNANGRGKTTHTGTSWPEGKTRYVLLQRI